MATTRAVSFSHILDFKTMGLAVTLIGFWFRLLLYLVQNDII